MARFRFIPLAALAGLALALGTAASSVPAAAAGLPARAGRAADPVYYLDGVRVDKAKVDQLDPQAIAYMNVLDEATARRVFGPAAGKVAVVVTKAQQNSAAVLALNARVAKVAPLVPGTETDADVNVLTPAALAYITKTYPNARLIGVKKISYPSTGRVLYRAELAEGRRPTSVLFDEQGNVAKP